MNVRGGFTRQLFPERRRSQGFDLSTLGFSSRLVALAPKDIATFPFINYDGFQDFGVSESGDGFFTTDVYSVTGSLMWVVGSHNTKFGAEYRGYIENGSRFSTAASPRIDFSTAWTRGPLDNSPAAPFGQDFASFLLGLPTGGTMSRAAAYAERIAVLSFYAHDDWRARENLTLNLGLRWEIEEPLTEADGRFVSGFDFDTASAIAAAAQASYARNPIPEIPADRFRVRGGLLYPDTGGPKKAWERNLANVMPRAGLAWLAAPHTAVRGGYGLFYDMLGANRLTVNQVGYARDTALTPSLDNGQTFIATLPNPFAGLLPGTVLNGANVSRRQLLRPYPQFTSVQATETIGTSDYHALQARVERRMAQGFTVQLAYSWSRAMIAGATGNASGYLNDFDEQPERVVSPFDRAHTFVTSGLVELPFGRGRRFGDEWTGVTNALAGGWQVSYIFKAQSGAPLGFGNFLFAEGMGVDDIMAADPTVDQWFNVNAFNRVPAQQLVSNVRTQPSRFADLRGPGYAVLDLGLLKNFSLGGARQVQLRLESYNAFNRVNLQNPNTTTTSTALGIISAQNGLPRQLQIAARVSF